MRDCLEYEASDASDERKVNWNNPAIGDALPELAEWIPPRLSRFKLEDGSEKAGRPCDLSAVAYSFLVSQRAIEALGPILADDALLYPVSLPDYEIEYSILVPQFTIDCIDRERSEGDIRKYGPLAGYFSNIRKLVVDESKLNGHNLFMLPDSRLALYVTEGFRIAIKDANLTGFELRKSHWDTSPWISG